jgi:hypothetical protein
MFADLPLVPVESFSKGIIGYEFLRPCKAEGVQVGQDGILAP